MGVPGGAIVKKSTCSAGDARDASSVAESGRSPGEGNGTPLQCSCLENPGDGETGGPPSVGSHRVGHD